MSAGRGAPLAGIGRDTIGANGQQCKRLNQHGRTEGRAMSAGRGAPLAGIGRDTIGASGRQCSA